MGLGWAYPQSTRATPQRERIPNRPDQVENNAGGFVWQLDCWKRLDRFLILGVEGGTYYATERKLARDNVATLAHCLEVDGLRTIARIVEISESGRAPKNDPALFALAYACAHDDAATKHAAYAALPRVARIGTHLFHFAEFVQLFRGWGRGLRRAVANWYTSKDPDDLAFQILKYPSRDGWSHRDLLRLAHPRDGVRNEIFKYAVHKPAEIDGLPEICSAALDLDLAESDEHAAFLIAAHRLPREMVPTERLNSKIVWEALLQDMPIAAMIRSLAKMTAVGLVGTFATEASTTIVERLTDAEAIRRSRVHPIQILSALNTYAAGHGERGKLTWTPNQNITNALDAAFYLAFDNVEVSGKATLLAIDVSGSMDGGVVAGVPGLTPRVAAAAMALVTASVEPNVSLIGFSHDLVHLKIGKGMRLLDAVRYMQGCPMGRTDCAAPIVAAQRLKWPVESFAVYTDSETWFGNIHPAQALRAYRQQTGIAARLAVVGMTATDFSIADPQDPGMLDVVGFDTAAPALIADFGAGRFA